MCHEALMKTTQALSTACTACIIDVSTAVAVQLLFSGWASLGTDFIKEAVQQQTALEL